MPLLPVGARDLPGVLEQVRMLSAPSCERDAKTHITTSWAQA
jgi:hypothetical protein